MEQTLKTGACSAVLGWLAETSLGFANLRRLLLAARQGEAWGSLFRPAQAAESASAAERLRLRLSPCPDDRLQVNIVKRRGGWPLSGIELDLAENEQTLHEGGIGTPALASFETPAAGLADASKTTIRDATGSAANMKALWLAAHFPTSGSRFTAIRRLTAATTTSPRR